MPMKHQAKKHTDRPHVAKKRSKGHPASHKHWIVVADQNKAHVYRRTPNGIERIPDMNACCSRPFPVDNVTSNRAFLHQLAEWLEAAEQEKAFERLVLIAPPSAMADIRALLGEDVHTRICAALDREVEQLQEDEIEDHIAEIVWL